MAEKKEESIEQVGIKTFFDTGEEVVWDLDDGMSVYQEPEITTDTKETEKDNEVEQADKKEVKPKKEDNKAKDTPEDEVETISPAETDIALERAIAFASDLTDAGVLEAFDDKDFKEKYSTMGAKALTEMLMEQQEKAIANIAQEIQANLDEQYERLYGTPEQKEFFNLLKSGVDFDTAKKLFVERKAYESLSPRDLEDNEELMEEIIKADYERQGIKPDRINRLLKKIKEDPDDMYEDAKEALDNMKTYAKEKENKKIAEETMARQEAENQRKAAQERMVQAREHLNKYITGLEAVGDIKISDVDKKKVYDLMTRPIEYAPDSTGQKRPVYFLEKLRSKNPYGFDTLVTLYAAKGLLDFDSNGNPKPNYSYFDAKAEKRVKSRVDDVIERNVVGKSENKKSDENPYTKFFGKKD